MTQKRKRSPIPPPPSGRGFNFFQQLWEQIRLSWALLKDSRVPLLYKILPLITIAYLLSPIDLIPDVLIGVGWLDDAGLLMLGLSAFNNLVPTEIVAEHLRRLRLSGKYKVSKDEQGMVIDVQAESVDTDASAEWESDETLTDHTEAKRTTRG